MESNGKKIQFAVPALQSPLDPKAAEHIRRRRPTPATLVVYRDTSADLQPSSQSGQHAQARPAQRKRSVYTPPTLIEREIPEHSRTQEVRDLGLTRPVSTATESSSGSTPRRKDTPYQHLPPFTPGGRLLENHTPFSEEEEQDGEEEEGGEEEEEKKKGVPH
ncbi:protein phosphatase 1 regulatory subunit 1C [Osmerus eperlanus]|uniref:protein phosphatase 1 regulatory subunit 1C n=1 Tax=Osmerus eperlanus TaxID=29151 RepID=UPI002E0F82D8